MKQRETEPLSVVSEATARPWTVCHELFDGKVIGFHIAGSPYGSTKPICRASEYHNDAPSLQANAALIVKAVNSYEALVKALEAVLEVDAHGWAVAPMNHDLRVQLTAALAGAK